MTRADPISVIEAAYRLELDGASWLDALSASAATCFGAGRGAIAMLYDASRDDWIQIEGLGQAQIAPALLDDLLNRPEAPSEDILRLYRSPQFTTFWSEPVLRRMYEPTLHAHELQDIVGINATDPTLRGCVLLIPSQRQRHPAPTQQLWRRLAAHIAAGARLRRTLGTTLAQGGDCARHAEAVLTPAGTVEHAVGGAKPQQAREALRDALVDIDRARSRREEPDRAVELWRGLVSGRWSVAEHFERDGKRYYLAVRNDPELAPDRALTARERQVLGYAKLGHSNKLIAYSLGLSLSSVATLLARARRKLGKPPPL